MRELYQPASAIDANLLLHVLQSEGIGARLDGEYLQGAIGDLPAAGLLRLMVEEQDYQRARVIVEEWEKPSSRSPAPTPAPGRRTALVLGLALGAAMGIIFSWMYYRTPVSYSGVDHDGDGRNDIRYVYANQQITRTEQDRNLDGRIDLVTFFDQRGLAERGESDENFDGRMETRQELRNDLYHTEFSDSNGDGFEESVWHYEHGSLRSIQHLAPHTGLPLSEFTFNGSRVVTVSYDSNGDGTLDHAIAFDDEGRQTTMP